MSLLNSLGMGTLMMETLSLGDVYTDFFTSPLLPIIETRKDVSYFYQRIKKEKSIIITHIQNSTS